MQDGKRVSEKHSTSTEKKNQDSFFSPLRGSKRILLAGFTKRTGWHSLNFLHQHGISCIIYDKSWDDEKKKLADEICSCFATNDFSKLIPLLDPSKEDGINHVLLSPGVPRKQDFFEKCEKMGIPVWSEMDFFFPLYKDKTIIAVTGTNGKTSTALLIHHLLTPVIPTVLAGNIGFPITSYLQEISLYKVVVLELSSYMLEKTYRFKPNVAIITNLGEDHLDRYNSIESYHKAKLNLLNRMTERDFFIWNTDDAILKNLDAISPDKRKFQLIPIGTHEENRENKMEKFLKNIVGDEDGDENKDETQNETKNKTGDDLPEHLEEFETENLGKDEVKNNASGEKSEADNDDPSSELKIAAGEDAKSNEINNEMKIAVERRAKSDLLKQKAKVAAWYEGKSPKTLNWKNSSEKKWQVDDKRKELGLFMANENLLSALAASLTVTSIDANYLEQRLASFRLPLHRMQRVAHNQKGSIEFIDDSKATTPQSVQHALSFFASEKKVFLILGGENKGLSFLFLQQYKKELNPLFLYGKSAKEIANQLIGKDPSWKENIIIDKHLTDATKNAYRHALRLVEKKNGMHAVVLLSPGCASFDQFSNYEERGATFAKCAKDLVGKK